jgi:hypothetical protein
MPDSLKARVDMQLDTTGTGTGYVYAASVYEFPMVAGDF